MASCIFCSIVKQEDKELCSKLENTILYEDNNVIITPALGMSIANYLMIVSKKHLNGFAELSEKDLLKLESLLNNICNEYLKTLGVYPIIFEHGSLFEGRHPHSITHAHMHIIPVNLSQEKITRLFDELKLKQEENIISIQKMKYKDYWMYRSSSEKYHMSNSIMDAPRSCFIKLVAEENGFDNSYEWRDKENNKKSDIEETIKTFNKLNIR